MNKAEIILALNNSYQSMAANCHRIAQKEFYESIGSKWSVAENLRHLTVSAKIFNKALNAPKIGLSIKLGRTLRKSKSYDQIVSEYQNATFPSTTGFEPRFKEDSTKQGEISEFLQHHNEIVKALNKWNEFQINTYIVPHPILGKTTLRELLYFMIYHTQHHEKAVMRLKNQKPYL